MFKSSLCSTGTVKFGASSQLVFQVWRIPHYPVKIRPSPQNKSLSLASFEEREHLYRLVQALSFQLTFEANWISDYKQENPVSTGSLFF